MDKGQDHLGYLNADGSQPLTEREGEIFPCVPPLIQLEVMDEGLAKLLRRAPRLQAVHLPGLPADRTRYPFIFLHNIGNASRWDALDMRRHPLAEQTMEEGKQQFMHDAGRAEITLLGRNAVHLREFEFQST